MGKRRKHFNTAVSSSLALLVSVPIMYVSVFEQQIVQTHARLRSGSISSVRSASSLSSTSSLSSRTSSINRTTGGGSGVSRLPKILGGISIAVAGISLVGTGVTIALTQEQYGQSKETMQRIKDNSYSTFYEDREKQMQALYDQYGVPMPDKYKNPYGNKKDEILIDTRFDMG